MFKRNVLYFFVFACFCISALYSGEKVLFAIFITMLLIPFISLLFLVVAVLRYKYVEQMDKNEILRGHVLRYSCKVYNKDLFPYPFVQVNFYADDFTAEEIFEDETFYLNPLNRYDIDKEIICEHIGIYHIGIKSFYFRDFFGFFEITSKPRNGKKEIKILPKIVELNGFKVGRTTNSDSIHFTSKIGMEDYSEIAEVNKYIPGLPLKSIHWKLSAKRNELMSKKFSNPQSSLTYLLADISCLMKIDKNNSLVKDIIIETIIAVLNFFVRKEIPIHLCFNDSSDKRLRVGSKREFREVYHKLLRADFKEIFPFDNMLHLSRVDLAECNEVIVIGTDCSESLFNRLVNLKLAGKDVIFIYPISAIDRKSLDFSRFLQGLQENGIFVYTISHADEIKKTLEM
ncbi:DUF58 domain-containing protein [Petroclostridium sp. X23]|uniref:DUF58 domain-containing protein n=1 Tax=Petroclostridium sp. X23 TaxID=3045146 RepID=UPI0024AD846A|nr:DUF58 domain-containing protein [Petroclostridium sp. X23]WHH60293.1 DUF58 domain-containing protein [Petroclostridium sp. X23]